MRRRQATYFEELEKSQELPSNDPEGADVENEHVLVETTFLSPTVCAVCDHLLLGATNQGLACSRCRLYTVHRECVQKGGPLNYCNPPGSHTFSARIFAASIPCCACGQHIRRNQIGVVCDRCGNVAHNHCQKNVTLDCFVNPADACCSRCNCCFL
eukprot:TRINITY_DN10496_c0_g1_i1.p2 TRINITY_DN10496_c0_g1~~TRINITY_DN10496_c0_g1_i1.p2  ORF type:complete len:156 (-),score=10.93 TRINITY_DN10496_c0_g1_i1:11-478(-)